MVLWFDRLDRSNRDTAAGVRPLLAAFMNRAVEGGGIRNPLERAYDDLFFNAYTVALSLRQIEKHYELLKGVWPTEHSDVARKFRKESGKAKIAMLRNILEHSAIYTTGGGKHKALVRSPDRGPNIELNSAGNGIKTISTFGIQFFVEPAIAAALELAEPIRSRRSSSKKNTEESEK